MKIYRKYKCEYIINIKYTRCKEKIKNKRCGVSINNNHKK